MTILIIGGGGREHAIAAALHADARVTKLWCAPGNGGIASIAECVPIKATDLDGICEFAGRVKPDLVVVAPDDPLALGLVDRLEAMGIPAFGPHANAAVIESSKSFSKGLMKKYGIPTADYAVFTTEAEALAYVREKGAPIVVKADGLALGKGVTVAQTVREAEAAVHAAMGGHAFGGAGETLVIEECLSGPELSLLCFTDGKTVCPMVSSRDHKRAYDGDTGPNTGGMGAIAPCPDFTPDLLARSMSEIAVPAVKAMAAEGRLFKGVLYCGLMLTAEGPKVIEFNARFGDPEAQVVLPLLDTPLLDILRACVDGTLGSLDIKWKSGFAAAVVLASGGYPLKYQTGFPISGLSEAEAAGATVYHAGTKLSPAGEVLTSGGRVLAVTALAPTLPGAIAESYAAAAKIGFTGMHFRRDIGASSLKLIKK